MSEPVEFDEAEWEQYLSDCRAKGVRPDMSDFGVWRSEHDLDEIDWNEVNLA